MKKGKKLLSYILFLVVCVGTVLPVKAATQSFSGTLNYRLLDGSANGVFYDIIAGTTLKMKGVAGCSSCDDITAQQGITNIKCFQGGNSGHGTVICSSTVQLGIYESENFVATGVPTKTKCYLYIYKTEDDGYNIHISGSLSQ